MTDDLLDILWITDPWHSLDHDNDTTLRLAEECIRLGCCCYWADYTSIHRQNNKTLVLAANMYTNDGAHRITVDRGTLRWVGTFQRVIYRPDPPVDLRYTLPLQLLTADIHGLTSTLDSTILNPPEVLFGSSEKVEAALIELMPDTVISSRWALLEAFGVASERTVLKPLNAAQSQGVHVLSWANEVQRLEAYEHVKNLSNDWSLPVVLQKYLPAIMDGEYRIWFAGGDPIGVVRKTTTHAEGLLDFNKGAKVESCGLSSEQQFIVGKLTAHLKRRNIMMAAVDLIGSYVTDLNFTSPGLLVEMERVYSSNLAIHVANCLITLSRRVG
jgi:glutathione synthase